MKMIQKQSESQVAYLQVKSKLDALLNNVKMQNLSKKSLQPSFHIGGRENQPAFWYFKLIKIIAMNPVSYRMKQQNLVRSKTQGFLKYPLLHTGTINNPPQGPIQSHPFTISLKQYCNSDSDIQ